MYALSTHPFSCVGPKYKDVQIIADTGWAQLKSVISASHFA
jgi:hypothetical protein